MQGRGYHQACHQDEQEGWITGQITHTLAKEFPQNMALGGHKRQALFFLLSAHQVACWGQSSTCKCGDWAHTVDEIGWKKMSPDWVVTDVYRVLSKTGFLEDPLLTSAASRVLWPPCCLKRGAPKINWLNCRAPSSPPTINSARKVSIRTLPGSGQASFFPTRARTWARQAGIERKCGQLPPSIFDWLFRYSQTVSQGDNVCLSPMTSSGWPWRHVSELYKRCPGLSISMNTRSRIL